MRDRDKSTSGNGKSTGGLGKAVLISRPVTEERGVNWLGIAVLIPLIIVLLLFAYGLFYRLAEERVDVEDTEQVVEDGSSDIESAVFSYNEASVEVAEVVESVDPIQKVAPPIIEKIERNRFSIPKPAVILDKDEYAEGLEEKLRIMATRLNEQQKSYGMLRESLGNAEERNKELLVEREDLRSRVGDLEQQLEDATLILEEIANY